MAIPTQQLIEQGQSVWLDYIRRGLLTSGGVARMVEDGWITGMTSNPTIFDKAISGSSDYEEALQAITRMGEADSYDAFVALASEDIRMAADALRPIYDATAAVDGYVSLEVPPGIEHDRDATVAEAQRLFRLVDRPNVLIKVPGTSAGVEALTELIADGVNINVTLLFAVAVYERVAEAYIAGLERRLAAGGTVNTIASVASFFVSRVDTAVDGELAKDSPLRGTVAVANARYAYERFLEIFSGPRWDSLAAAGAHHQRPLWASTGTKNAAYSDTLYVETLIAPHTVNTMPQATLDAVLDHLVVEPTLEPNFDDARRVLDAVAVAGIDLEAVTDKLLVDGLASFEGDFVSLLDKLGRRLATAPGRRPAAQLALGDLAERVDQRLATMRTEDIVERIWAGDHTVWKPDPTEISDRLGFLTVADRARAEAADLANFAADVVAAGYTDAVLLGMGGSSLAPEVLRTTLGRADGALELHVLDTTDPEQILDLEAQLDLAKTLFIVASKSGGTIEPNSQFAYFWERIPDGAHFIAITDPGTSLEALGREHGFRRVFNAQPDIGGRYSALSAFGMVPAALIGADIAQLAMRAQEMFEACRNSVAHENPGALLGAVMGEAALGGRDKLTLVLPDEMRSFGYWVEQLIAESTGKEGTGILPVEGEPLGGPDVYGDDRLFVALGEHADLAALEAAGHPVVRLPYCDAAQLPAEFARWEFATAVAGHVLGIQPFDQPNVQEAKDATDRVLAEPVPPPATGSLARLLSSLGSGDYLALLAYLPRTGESQAILQSLRTRLRDRYRVATTVGFGPRFLHSTGQLHKGGPTSGAFVQIVREDPVDAEIPGKPYSFSQLKTAQAQGDLESLVARGRRVARVGLDELVGEVTE